VPVEATNVESAFGFTFGDSTRFFVQARRFDGSLVVWGNVASGLTNVPAGLTNIVRVTLLGENFSGTGGWQDQEIRRNPYLVAETSDGKVAIWGGRGTNGGDDPSLGYLTNRVTPLSGVTKLIVHNYTNVSSFYPIIVAERGSNTPVVWANNSLSNVPAFATNLSRLILTGGTNGSESSKPRFFVGETSDKRVVIWSNGISGSHGLSCLGERTESVGIQNFELVGANTGYPVIVARQSNNSLLVWGGNVSQPAGTNFIPNGCTNVTDFMTLDPEFSMESSDRNVRPLVIANTSEGKLLVWWATGQVSPGIYDSLSNSLNSLASATGAKLFPYSQENLSTPGMAGYAGHGGSGIPWPVIYAVGGQSRAPLVVSGHPASASVNPAPTTPETFELSQIEAIYPIGSARTPDTATPGGYGGYSYSFAIRMKDGTIRIQNVTDSSFTSYGNRTYLYFSSPNSSVLHIFSGKGAGLTSGALGGAAPGMFNAYDNLVIIAEPALLNP